MHRYASSPFFFLISRILLTFQADQTPVAVSSLGMLLRSPFGGTLCLLLCYRRYDHHRTAHVFPVYYTFLACASHHTLCLLLCHRRYSSQPGHCDCELPATLLSAALANAQAGAYFFFGCGGVEEHPCAVVCTTSEDCSGGGWSTSAFTWRRLIVDTTLPGTPRRQLSLGNEAAVPSCAHSHRVELLQIASARSF